MIAVCLVMCLLLAGCAENPAGTGNNSLQTEQQTGNESTASAGSETKASESEAADNIVETEKPADADASDAPVVYFTSDISAEGLVRIYETLDWTPEGNVAVKISTGEPPDSNYLRPELIGNLVKKVDGTIVECNTAYGGSRSSSAMHKQVAEDHGFTAIADFDLMDEEGEMEWPMSGGTSMTFIKD